MASQNKMSEKTLQKMAQMKTDRENREKNRWVINLSSTPLTEDQERLLAHGPKFVTTPRETPVKEYIAATEQACMKIEQGKQEEF